MPAAIQGQPILESDGLVQGFVQDLAIIHDRPGMRSGHLARNPRRRHNAFAGAA
jgi:hypothetical protein